MKKRYKIAAFFTPLFLLAVPAYAQTAVQWPPPVYEMPRVPYDPKAWSVFLPSIKMTIKSIGSTGLIILGVCVSVGLISSLFHSLFLDRLSYMEGVKRREKSRTIKAMDIAFNRDAIVNEKAMDMQLNSEAKELFRSRNPNADMEEKIYQRQVAYQANIEFARRNPDLTLQNSVMRREISFEADNQFNSRNKNSIHEKAVANRQRSAYAEMDYVSRNTDSALRNSLLRREVAFAVDDLFQSQNEKAIHEKAVLNRQRSAFAEMDYVKRNPELTLHNNILRREVAFEADNQFQTRNESAIHEKAVWNRHRSALADIDYIARSSELEKFKKYLHDDLDLELRQERPEMYTRRKALNEELRRKYWEGTQTTRVARKGKR